MTAIAFRIRRPGPGHRPGPAALLAAAPGDGRHAGLGRGCRPRGCRAPARRVRGRRVRYHIGSEPGQINGRRWRSAAAR
ncbi:tryptophan biosynthesis modulator TrpM [Streptomyces bugieae]|uniref:Tryptophan synthase subunit(Beta) n=1 Tax=Streptomyces bugieae TaxID=3098223 RepID=A0ABU7P0N3_9ACTN|nr:tryptophan synthase subunit(beta) [Streptomyces sp. DSM 41528]